MGSALFLRRVEPTCLAAFPPLSTTFVQHHLPLAKRTYIWHPRHVSLVKHLVFPSHPVRTVREMPVNATKATAAACLPYHRVFWVSKRSRTGQIHGKLGQIHRRVPVGR
jgi:hypothetical protein